MFRDQAPSEAPAPPPSPAPRKKKGPGCFFWGCLSCLLILGIVVIAGVAVVRKTIGLIDEYTSEAPMQVPAVTYSYEQMAELDARLERFEKALERGESARLVLSADDLNAKISTMKEFREAGGRAHVQIPGDQITATLSIPLEKLLPIGRFKGRHLNGKATIRIALSAGNLTLLVDKLEANGKALPEDWMREIRKKNIGAEMTEDPEFRKTIAKVKRINVQDGKLIVER